MEAGVGGPAYLSLCDYVSMTLRQGEGPFWVPLAAAEDAGLISAKQKAFESLTPSHTPTPFPPQKAPLVCKKAWGGLIYKKFRT